MGSKSSLAFNTCFKAGTRASLKSSNVNDKASEWRELVCSLGPSIRAGIVRALVRRRGRANGYNVMHQVEELTQDIFLALLDQDGRRLRAWNPQRGLSLHGFVKLLAERETASRLRTARRNPWTEMASDPEYLDSSDSGAFERRLESRQLLHALLAQLQRTMSPLGAKLFEKLWIQNREVSEVCRQFGMSADAVYAWRSRLSKLARQLYAEMTAAGPAMSECTSHPRNTF